MHVRTRYGASDEIETKDLSQCDEVDFVLDLHIADLHQLIRIHVFPQDLYASFALVIVFDSRFGSSLDPADYAPTLIEGISNVIRTIAAQRGAASVSVVPFAIG